MKIQILVILIVMFLSGCDLFKESCDTYCENDVIHHCTNNGGLMGGKNEWDETDCKEDNLFCLERGNSAYCVFTADECNSTSDSFCTDEKVADCIEEDGKFYALFMDYCHSFDNEKCVEFQTGAKCVVPVEECNSKAEKVCVEKKPVECYEKDGEFFIETRYIEECHYYEECVEVDNTALCLEPVEVCRPSKDLSCIDNQKGRCWEKDGLFYASFSYDCDWIDNSVCVEFGNNKVECLIPVYECDPDTENFCYGSGIAKCYENNGKYYIDFLYNCLNGADDKCVFDSSTKKAECLIPED